MNRKLLFGLVTAALMIGAGVSFGLFGAAATQVSAQSNVPTFQEDLSWPKMPAKWKLGNVASVAVDSRDHVWILSRPRTLPADQLAMAAPPVMEFDPAGNFVQAWGGDGQGYEWPQREHGIFVDHKDNVWVGGNNEKTRKLPLLKPIDDTQILKFTRNGKFLLQIGRADQSGGNADTKNLRQPADVFVYSKTNEVFVADGYGNDRMIVFDADTGAFKRMWGAFGKPPVDNDRRPPNAAPGPNGPEHFNTVHAVRVSNDGFVYAADRGNKRVQVFTLDGTFVSQATIAPQTKGLTARSVAFSPDPQQTFMYVGGQPEIWVLERKTLKTLGSVATPNAHHFAADSKGNIYTAETEESRSRKFVMKAGPAISSR